MKSLKVVNLGKTFDVGKEKKEVLHEINFELHGNEMVFICGDSGSGKSTLLTTIGLIQTPTEGEIYYDGVKINFNDKKQINSFLSDRISFVFQECNLLEDFSVLENLEIVNKDTSFIEEILELVNLKHLVHSPTRFLSGGEKQRLAIGRALAKHSDIILLDEPTGNLDSENAEKIFTLLKEISYSKTVVVVSHDIEASKRYADKTLFLKSGHVDEVIDFSNFSFSVDLKSGEFDEFAVLLDFVEKRKFSGDFTVKTNDGKTSSSCETFHMQNGKRLSVVKKLFERFNGTAIEIVINFTKMRQKQPLEHPSRSPNLSLVFACKYAMKLFKKKFFRNMLSVILLTINIILVFSFITVINFNPANAILNGITANGVDYSLVYRSESNTNLNSKIKVNSGEDFLSNFEDNLNNKPIPYIFCNSNFSNVNIYLNVIDVDVNFYDNLIHAPAYGTIDITNFTRELSSGSEILLSLFCNYFTESISLPIGNVIDVPYDENDLFNQLNDNNYQSEKSDEFSSKYAVAFISSSTFSSIKENLKYNVPASNFLMSDIYTMKNYVNTQLVYQKYNEHILIEGRAPSALNEVVISERYFDTIKYYYGLENYSDIIGEVFSFKNLKLSPNYTSYQHYLNLHDLSESVCVVGITENTECDVLTSEDFFTAFTTKVNYFLSGYYAEVSHSYNYISSFSKLGYFYDLGFLNSVNVFSDVLNGEISTILVVVALAILLTTILYLFSTANLNVKEKYKEISILKSLGIQKHRLPTIFIMLNLLIAALAIVIGLPLSYLAIHLVNAAFASPSVFNLNYLLLVPGFLPLLIVLVVVIVVMVLTTIVSFLKLKKIDVSTALKKFD